MNSTWKKNKKNKNYFPKGYTLTELLIVLAVIGFSAALSWSSLSKSRHTSAVSNACNEIASMVNKTRNYALSGKIVSGNVPSSFRITVGAKNVSVSPTGESFAIPGAVSCTPVAFEYGVPNGNCSSGCPATITCSIAGGTSKIIEVSRTRAVCK